MDCLALQEFYEATVKHRRLTWYYHSGQATIKGNFKAKPIDMLMSTTQAAVVLLFNSGWDIFCAIWLSLTLMVSACPPTFSWLAAHMPNPGSTIRRISLNSTVAQGKSCPLLGTGRKSIFTSLV